MAYISSVPLNIMLHLYNCALVMDYSFHDHNALCLWNTHAAWMHSRNVVLCTVFVIVRAAVWLSFNSVVYVNEVTLLTTQVNSVWPFVCEHSHWVLRRRAPFYGSNGMFNDAALLHYYVHWLIDWLIDWLIALLEHVILNHGSQTCEQCLRHLTYLHYQNYQ